MLIKKILYCASTASHIKNFHMPYIKWLSERGYEVTVLTEGFAKTIFSTKNIKTLFKTRRMLADGNFHAVITNTTLAGVVVRASVLLNPKKRRPRVLHICHGLLFSDGSSIKKLLYLLPERICAAVTDVYAVMNAECERIAIKYKLGKKIIFTRGMGIDLNKFKQVGERCDGGFRFVYAAEFSKRKNQIELIRAFARSSGKMPDAELLLAGDGKTLSKCKKLAERLGIGCSVAFLGYVDDIHTLLSKCDAAVSSSKHEGLPFNILEAMACGLPIVASDTAGHTDLLESGFLYRTERELSEKLGTLYHEGKRSIVYGDFEKYGYDSVRMEWERIFNMILADTEDETGDKGR